MYQKKKKSCLQVNIWFIYMLAIFQILNVSYTVTLSFQGEGKKQEIVFTS